MFDFVKFSILPWEQVVYNDLSQCHISIFDGPVTSEKSMVLTCRNSSFPSLWEHWKFVPTWRKSRTRAVYLFMWYITSYIWYIGAQPCHEKQRWSLHNIILQPNWDEWSPSHPIKVWTKPRHKIQIEGLRELVLIIKSDLFSLFLFLSLGRS